MASKWLIVLGANVVFSTVAFAVDQNPADTEWRVFANSSCVITDEPFLMPQSDDGVAARLVPLFGIIAGKVAGTLISGLIQGVVGSINEFAARKDTQFVIAKDFNLYLAELSESPEVILNPQLGCFTVVAGQFHPGPVDCTGDYIPREVTLDSLQLPQTEWQTARTDNSIENILKRANICMIGQTKSAYEARIILSDDKTAYRMSNAGYWINSLTSTKSARASRNMLYTLEILQPSDRSGGQVLSTAWVNIGEVSAGDVAIGPANEDSAEWLRVPLMSRPARQAHASNTAVHQNVIGQIDALERAIVRDERLLAGIRERAASAASEVRVGLEKEMPKIGVRIVTAEAMLDARRAEYDDLPQSTMYFMPVTMRFGVTETRSEKRTMQLLATILKANKRALTATATAMVNAQILNMDRSLALEAPESDLSSARNVYFDALVAVNATSPYSNEELEQLEANLTEAKQSYNAARLAEGLDPIR